MRSKGATAAQALKTWTTHTRLLVNESQCENGAGHSALTGTRFADSLAEKSEPLDILPLPPMDTKHASLDLKRAFASFARTEVRKGY